MLQLTFAAKEVAGPIASATRAILAIHRRMFMNSSAVLGQMVDG
jgi:hypothetical protein